MHKAMGKDAANGLADKHLESKDGRFFLRPRSDDSTTEFVLLVIYRGKPTQHLVGKGVQIKATFLASTAHRAPHTRW
jgi:hypothetical protein